VKELQTDYQSLGGVDKERSRVKVVALTKGRSRTLPKNIDRLLENTSSELHA